MRCEVMRGEVMRGEGRCDATAGLIAEPDVPPHCATSPRARTAEAEVFAAINAYADPIDVEVHPLQRPRRRRPAAATT